MHQVFPTAPPLSKRRTQLTAYVGRFAPTPSGPLHLGSLVAALGSFLDARRHGGRWLLRIDDLDPLRVASDAIRHIAQELQRHGLHWDGAAVFQSQRSAAYVQALERLRAAGDTYFCNCSRRRIEVEGNACSCRLAAHDKHQGAERLHVPAGRVACADQLYGDISSDVANATGDFVLQRRDGHFAYQLAVVVDDAESGVTHVVRGFDLLDNTPRQVLLQQRLGLPTPEYLHLPLALTPEGQKLSKQAHAPPLAGAAQDNLLAALRILGQSLPADAGTSSCAKLLTSATQSWQRGAIPRMLRRRTD